MVDVSSFQEPFSCLNKMAMAPEIQEYYKHLLGEIDAPPGPIVLPEGFSATVLAKVSTQLLT